MQRTILVLLAILALCCATEAKDKEKKKDKGDKFGWGASYTVRAADGTTFGGSERLWGAGDEAEKARKEVPKASKRLTRHYVFSLDYAGGNHPKPEVLVVEKVVETVVVQQPPPVVIREVPVYVAPVPVVPVTPVYFPARFAYPPPYATHAVRYP